VKEFPPSKGPDDSAQSESHLDTESNTDPISELTAYGAEDGGTGQTKRGGHRRGAGRKRLEFDLRLVEKFGTLGCSNKAMAYLLGTTERTIERRLKADRKFADAFGHCDAVGCVKILRRQFELLNERNTAMAIHLGKVRCGQRYKTELSGPNDGPIPVTVEDFGEILEQARKTKHS